MDFLAIIYMCIYTHMYFHLCIYLFIYLPKNILVFLNLPVLPSKLTPSFGVPCRKESHRLWAHEEPDTFFPIFFSLTLCLLVGMVVE